MARDLRDQVAGGTFHVMNRGNRKQQIFEDERDRRKFWQLLADEKAVHGVEVCGDCQMGNHFHMIVTTPYGNLADFVGAVEGRFASYSNWRHHHVGHLFQNRYKSIYIADDIHLLTALCYVFLNPVSAGYVKNIEDYRWSSYRATIGLRQPASYLSLDWLETFFPGEPRAHAQRRFAALFREAKPVFAYFKQHDADIEATAAKRVLRSYIGSRLRVARLPRQYRSVLRDSLPELFPRGLRKGELGRAVHDARVIHGYKVVEIAQHLRMHRATVSRIFRAEAASQARS
jgi:putative transposase